MRVKALTVRQPWAWAIMKGYKPEENRTWSTTYGGPLAIHAAKKWDEDAIPYVVRLLRRLGLPVPATFSDELPLAATGAVIGVVRLLTSCSATRPPFDGHCRCSLWAQRGQFHWRMADPVPLEDPVPARGQLGLWTVELPNPPMELRDRWASLQT